MFVGEARSLTWKALHLGRLPPYPQTLDYTGKACQGKRSSLSWKGVTYGRKMFYNIDTRPSPTTLRRPDMISLTSGSPDPPSALRSLFCVISPVAMAFSAAPLLSLEFEFPARLSGLTAEDEAAPSAESREASNDKKWSAEVAATV